MPCLCERDQDGQCQACKSVLTEFLDAYTKLFIEFQTKIHELTHRAKEQKASCRQCLAQYADFACAGMLAHCAAGIPEEVSRAIASCLAGMAQQFGATAIPLTQKAWMDLCKTQGWEP